VLVDAAAGTMDVVDPRPVSTDSLFQLHGASSTLLAALALKEVARGALRLDAPVSAVWPSFEAAGKASLSLTQLLNHQSGLSGCPPPGASLTQLSDLRRMSEIVAAATPDPEEAAGTPTHEGLAWGWAVAGTLERSSSMGIEELLERKITQPLGIERDLRLRVGADEIERCARVTARPLMKEAGMDVAEMLSGGGGGGGGGEAVGGEPGAGPEAGAVGDGAAATEAGDGGANASAGGAGGVAAIDWSEYEGATQLKNPATLNMKTMRQALLPGVSAHASAHALATFYNALGAGKLVPPALLSQAQQLSVSGTGPAGESVRFGLGFELGTCADFVSLQRMKNGIKEDAVSLLKDAVYEVRGRVVGEPARVVGHVGVGGTIGLCVPERKVALAITVSRLSGAKIASKKLVELLLGEVGLAPPVGLW
jgi:CubicO group peptidase (beta-lactamase class C family)